MYKYTTATKKINSLTKRIRAVCGGTSAGKTIGILQVLIGYAQSVDNQLISIVSETMPHLRKGAMRDFQNMLKAHGYWKDDNWNATNSIYTFETGTQIEFFSADQSDKVRGPRRDVLYINECNNVSLETFNQLEVRTKKIIWLDWNPVAEFWWYTDVAPHISHQFLTLTYLDNEALDTSIVKSIESRKGNKNWWQVYGLGQLGEAEGRIYTGWREVDRVPDTARLERYGLDFGYTNDPTSVVAIYRHDGGYILDEKVYQKGMSNKEIADTMSNFKRALIVADSAEPKSIDEIRVYGLNIVPAMKGPGSVNQGIQFVQGQNISVTKRSTNLLKEYRNYLWKTDREGKPLNVPDGLNDHALDALRYAMSSMAKNGIYFDPNDFPKQEVFNRYGFPTF